ncbi:MAG TPA: helix-turn-helix domain-containing protein [Acidimicrobiales bacterium]|nr:helix-turn-helix domain-containing protein [Acidimicrobiales bacterium]
MGILIRTSELPPARRREAWRELVCEALGPLEMRIDPEAPLHGEVEAGEVGSIGVGRVSTTTRHSVHRTSALVRRPSPEVHRLVLAVSGRPRVAQDDRALRLEPGQFTIYDFTRPYDLDYDGAVELAVFTLPHGSLALPFDALAHLTAVAVDGTAGTGALAASLLGRVAAEQGTYKPASAVRLSTVMTDLVSAALAERLDEPDVVASESQERLLALRVHAFIEQNLSDLQLDPAAVATAHHLSVRHLHRLFEPEHTTVAAWIRHRRLERCRADLADPALRDRPVSAVAARWGLTDAAHFSRLFRRTYGLSPTEHRRAHLSVA